MERETREREFKTSPEQWRVIIGYFEEYPVLLKNKFNSSDGDYEAQQKLWQQLTTQLNSMGLGARNIQKWQAAIGRWKSKTKAKASVLRLEAQRTGGGPPNAPPLNPTEERLMQLMGYKSITGDMNQELGIVKPTKSPLMTQSVSSVDVDSNLNSGESVAGPSHQKNIVIDGNKQGLPPLAPFTCKQKASKRGVKQGVNDIPKKIRTSCERTRRFVNMNKMHSEMMEKLSNIERNTGTMANALVEISNTMKEYFNYKKENG